MRVGFQRPATACGTGDLGFLQKRISPGRFGKADEKGRPTATLIQT